MRLVVGVALLLVFALAAVAAAAGWLASAPASATGIVAIEAGGGHTCAVTSAGGLRCWGLNEHGQLGDGAFANRQVPGDVLLSNVAQVAAGGEHTCALTTAGAVKCWGHNLYGEVGDGSASDRPFPTSVTGLQSGVAAITMGFFHACALTTSGGVKCWGSNSNGAIGTGATANYYTTPQDVVGLSSGVVAIDAGDLHTCALLANGGVKCWGWNLWGQIGDGTSGPSADRLTPVDVASVSNVEQLAVGLDHACVLMAGDAVRCWGYNAYGQIGDGTQTDRPSPVDITLGGTPLGFAMGGGHSCAILPDGVNCWGDNSYGEVGDGTSGNLRLTPTGVTGLAGLPAQLRGGAGHTCALVGGDVYCWGRNVEGQLGDGTTTNRSTPVPVAGGGKPPTPTPTATSTSTATPTPTPTPKQPFGDTDGDTIANDSDDDDDGDGCSDIEELSNEPLRGGNRNPHVFWDYFDTPGPGNVRDQAIVVSDISRVVARFGSFQMPPPAKGEAFAQALTPPPPAPAYHPGFDRTQAPGGFTGPPNGSITVTDIQAVVGQFSSSCGG